MRGERGDRGEGDVGAGGEHEQQRDAGQRTRQVTDQTQGVRIGPVQVFEDQHPTAPTRQLTDQRQHGLAEHDRRIDARRRDRLVRTPGQQATQRGAKRTRAVEAAAQHRGERLRDRPVRPTAEHRPPRQDGQAGVRRPRSDLADQPRLPDPRLPGDQQRRPDPARQPVDQPRRRGQLDGAADQHRAARDGGHGCQ